MCLHLCLHCTREPAFSVATQGIYVLRFLVILTSVIITTKKMYIKNPYFVDFLHCRCLHYVLPQTKLNSHVVHNKQFSKPIYIFACVVNGMNAVLTALGNTVILFALPKCHSLHSPSKALLFGLALADLFVRLVVLLLFTAYYLTIILEIPTYFCAIAVTYGRILDFFRLWCATAPRLKHLLISSFIYFRSRGIL